MRACAAGVLGAALGHLCCPYCNLPLPQVVVLGPWDTKPLLLLTIVNTYHCLPARSVLHTPMQLLPVASKSYTLLRMASPAEATAAASGHHQLLR